MRRKTRGARDAVIFDVDGTLSLAAHRRHFLKSSPPDWEAFFSTMDLDPPNEPLVRLFSALRKSGKFAMILVSGRPERYRERTEHWLRAHKVVYDQLMMRKDGDRREDPIIKMELLAKLRHDGFSVILAIDDRKSVVAMWRSQGVTCLQCDDGDF